MTTPTSEPADERSSGRQDRLDPTLDDHYLSIQHLERYIFAAKNLRAGTRILDVACGTGYGARILSDQGCNVIGGDLDESELIKVSRTTPDVGLVCLDVLKLPFADDTFDAVVSFETIEHVVEGERFLDEMHRVLKPRGLFICSTPNIAYTAHPWYHVKEYEPAEFYSLVLDKFKRTEKFGQYFRSLDRLSDRLTWLGNKPGLRKLSRLFTRIVVAPAVQLTRFQESIRRRDISRQTDTEDDGALGKDFYSVTSYRGSRLMRIMVTVSVK